MKNKLLFLILLLNYNIYSQYSNSQVIPSNLDGLNSIFSADIDGDGDMDVVSTSKNDNKLIWYENSDGNGTFTNQHILETHNGTLQTVFAADIDNDDDIDIIAGYGYSVVWYRNLDGLGNFSGEQTIASDDFILSVQAADIDGDGHKDIIYSDTYSGSKIQWLKNTDGQGNFGSNQTIASGIMGPNYFSVNDIDGDGDMDVVASSYDSFFPYFSENNISWYQNIDGNGNFGPKQTILMSAGSPEDILTLDIENDGDLDIVVASFYGDEVYCLKNLDGLGGFSDKIVLASTLDGAKSLFNFDFDNDGDQDIVVASNFANKITLLVNDSFGNFNEEIIVSENVDGAISVFASNIDGDNYTDIISASINDNIIAWYRNEFNLSIESNDFLDLSIYPNPTESILSIESKTEITKIEVYNQLGQLVEQNENRNEINISGLSKGIYFLRIEDINQNFEIRKIVKK